jgi:hypothetical protein
MTIVLRRVGKNLAKPLNRLHGPGMDTSGPFRGHYDRGVPTARRRRKQLFMLRRWISTASTTPASPTASSSWLRFLLVAVQALPRTLRTCEQTDVDTWLSEGPDVRTVIRPFLAWSATRRHTGRSSVPARFADGDQRDVKPANRPLLDTLA